MFAQCVCVCARVCARVCVCVYVHEAVRVRRCSVGFRLGREAQPGPDWAQPSAWRHLPTLKSCRRQCDRPVREMYILLELIYEVLWPFNQAEPRKKILL